jgi:hypothetical protein
MYPASTFPAEHLRLVGVAGASQDQFARHCGMRKGKSMVHSISSLSLKALWWLDIGELYFQLRMVL